MVIIMNSSSANNIFNLLNKLRKDGMEAYCIKNSGTTVISVFGTAKKCRLDIYKRLSGVRKIISISTPFKLVSREFKSNNSLVSVKNIIFGTNKIPIIAGPCAVESYDQFKKIAMAVKNAGADIVRGGVFKPRTSPYSFQGLGIKGLEILSVVGREVGIPVIAEITSPGQAENAAKYIDILQIGARNMQNFVLLREVGKINKPVLLKRGLSATIKEWLMAAEYIFLAGNENVILCERGIRTFETYTRNTLDLSAVALVKQLSHLPIIVDPSHGTGNWKLVGAMAKASIAAGADGLMIEVHHSPKEALSDGEQSLTPPKFFQLMKDLSNISKAFKRYI